MKAKRFLLMLAILFSLMVTLGIGACNGPLFIFNLELPDFFQSCSGDVVTPPDNNDDGNQADDNQDSGNQGGGNQNSGNQDDVSSQPSQGLEYTLNEDQQSYCVTGIGTCTDNEIVIPETYNEKPVTSIEHFAFYDCARLVSVVIPDSVTSIGSYAFEGCCNLEYNEYDNAYYLGNQNNKYLALIEAKNSSITTCIIHEDTKIIGNYAFGHCESLTSIEIPDSVTSIDENAFQICTNLTSVYIMDIEVWCNISFGNNYSNPLSDAKNLYLNNQLVTELVIPNSVTEIKKYAFLSCTSLTSVVIPDSVTSIGIAAFMGCTSLTRVEIPNSVTSIGADAFKYCTSLTSIEIPDSVTSIDENAFEVCTNLTSVYIMDIEAWCNISFGTNYSNPLSDAKNLYLNNELVTELVIPNSVTEIKAYTFYGCTSLTSVVIPDSVTSIGNGAFAGCYNLEYNQYDNAYYLGNQNNKYLLLVEVKNTSITTCTIHEDTKFIGSSAFSYCDSLTSVVIPDSVTSIGDYAFSSCSSLTSVVMGDSVTTIGDHAFNDCYNLTSVVIPDSVTSIGYYTFVSCSSLMSVEIPDSVTFIGSSAFYSCDSLTSVYYKGTAEEWAEISIGDENYNLTNATRYYYSESQPTEEGNYWHYDENGKPVAW